jgi:glycerol-3-phosphate dehydrogenase
MKYDVCIIGAGVSGSLIARALSKYDISLCLIDKENDVAMGTTKANSAIIHAGFDAVPGTYKAKLNVRGTEMMEETCKELHVEYKNNESLVVAFSQTENEHLKELYERGITNGVPDMKLLSGDEVRQLEPNLSEEITGALLAKTAGIVCPYKLTIAAAECAANNGCDFIRNAEVKGINIKDNLFVLDTTAGEITAEYVINAAGVHADKVASFIGDNSVEIRGRRGSYFILDKSQGNLVSRTIFQCPSEKGKGILVAPTVDGNLLLGPTSEFVDDKDLTDTTLEELKKVAELSAKSVPLASSRDAITSFSGIRAYPVGGDFVIGSSQANEKFINVAGIESPGLSAAPAIAELVDEMFASVSKNKFAIKADYDSTRKAPVRFREMTDDERRELIAKNSAYGRVICRCETVTEGEIIDAIRMKVGAVDVDGVKRRVRAGMGRCQGGFCGSKVVEILSRELNVPVNEVTKFGKGSNILFDKTKED